MCSRAFFIVLVTGGVACSAPATEVAGDADTDATDDTDPDAPTHTISGTVEGLTSSGLVLRNDGGDDLAVPAGASTFTFAARVADGGRYAVTVLDQPAPPAAPCAVLRGAGVARAEVTDVVVLCGRAFARALVAPGLDNPILAAGDFDALPLLSQTGVFSDLATLTPHPALIPYAVNAQLWSDNAVKSRWIAVPNDGPPYGRAEQIAFSATGSWELPAGTVAVKHFELVVDESTGARKRLETRVGVLLASGAFAGASYRWRADQRDAEIVSAKIEEADTVTTPDGTRAWTHTYPDPSMCPTCHRESAGLLLGVRTAQLNGDHAYPSGSTQNQLLAWGRAGMFSAEFAEAKLSSYLRTVPITDAAASLETRARSYFEGNCSPCHHPGGANATWDARFSTPLAQQGLIGNVVLAGDPAGSPLYRRMSYATVDTPADKDQMMPPLAKNHVDHDALDVIEQWILGLP